ncbi:hypothetical protein ABE073_04395 [Lederbergia citrisecunda]|uniref:hypothetical protein n=1 Tax=Lederbergia citrisecunda TaxID=2833583 RepID=UPI003D27CCF8
MNNKKFSELLNSYEDQSFESGCGQDWLDHFYMATKSYFKECEENGKRATTKGLKEKIVEIAESDIFQFNSN